MVPRDMQDLAEVFSKCVTNLIKLFDQNLPENKCKITHEILEKLNTAQSNAETVCLDQFFNILVKVYNPIDSTNILTIPKTLIKYRLKDQEVGDEEETILLFAKHVTDMAQLITKARDTISKQNVLEELVKILVSFLFDATICAALFSASAEDIHIRFDKAVKKASSKLTGNPETINFVVNTVKQRLDAIDTKDAAERLEKRDVIRDIEAF
ncbi:hypothetical protein CYMTET_44646 [Cymbomonas tetramitiformis]|uniref:Uncharacterized protein n=1 Tax=Cymbomonas tetramitiformis TaxID=36881 RepID=A0AAE0C1J0_9CHLO|nr:hypothetical protein CYMTET_44646 [Cymbomonas tetramitiformis]